MLTPPLDSWLRLPRGPIALAVLVAGTLLFGSLQRQPCIPDREIVELEVAGTTAKANTILSDWTAQCAARPGSTVGRQEVEAQVRASLRWDFAFIAFYATLLAFGCTLAARTLPRDPTGRFASALAALAWLQWPAGAFDAVENVALLKFLEGPTGVPWLRIAQGAALAKFALVIPGAAAAIVGLLVWLRRRARQSAQPELSVRSFKDVLAAERAQIEKRRVVAIHHVRADGQQGPPTKATLDETFPHYSGLALSGGGIRSATFCLGALQALDDRKLLPQFDYLSTVSGGGYVGGWWSAWLSRQGRTTLLPAQPRIERVRERKYRKNAPDAGITAGTDPVHHLRLFSNHLTPRKGLLSADLWRAVTVIARNIVLTWLTLVPLALAVVMVGQSYYLLPDRLWASSDPVSVANRSVRADFVQPRPQSPVASETTPADSAITAAAARDARDARNARLASRLRAAVLPIALLGVCLAALTIAWQLNSGGNPAVTLAGIIGSLALAALTWSTFVPGNGSSLPPWFAWVAIGGAVACLAPHVVRLFREELPSKSDPDARAARREAQRNRIGRQQARLLKLALGIGVLLAVAGFGHELVWYVLTDDGPAADWVKRSGGWLAVLLSVGSGVFTAIRATPSAMGEQKSAPGLLSRVAFAMAPLLFVLALSIAVATFAQWILSQPHRMGVLAQPRAILGLAALLLFLCAAYEVDTDGTESGGGKLHRLDTFGNVRAQLLAAGSALCVVLALLPFTALTTVENGEKSASHAAVAVAVIAACLVGVISAGWMSDPNLVALHTFYRGRLVRAFLGASNTKREQLDITETAPTDDLRLAKLTNCESGGPFHLVNTTLNLVGGRDLATAQRHAASFVLSKTHCGSLRTGYRPTEDYMDGGLTLGAAVAASGAAASPNMGAKTPSSALALLLALFNVRLGLWVPTPNRTRWRSSQPRLWPFYLLREALSQTTTLASYCYLTDGGHFDNTGVYSLVERGCQRIVVLDCGADPRPCFADIGDLIRRCRIDFGADIDLDVRPFLRDERGEAQAHAVHGSILYSAEHARTLGWGDRADFKSDEEWQQRRTGVVVWIKPSLTARERAELRQYALENPVFPQQTTTDQWFDEAQFESYRMLGERSVHLTFEGGLPKPDATDEQLAQWIAKSVEENLSMLKALGREVGDDEATKIGEVFRTVLRPSYDRRASDDQVRPPYPRRRRDEIQRAVDGIIAEALAAAEAKSPVTRELFFVPCRRARDTLWPLR